MKLRSSALAIGVICISFALHAAGFGLGYAPSEVQVAGGAPAEFARLGSGFEDMVMGIAQPVQPDMPDATEVAALSPPPVQMASVSPQVQQPVASAIPVEVTVTAVVAADVAVSPAPAETVTAEPDVTAQDAAADTPRPQRRPDRTERRQPEQQHARSAPRGSNSRQNTTRGQADGRQDVTATEASSGASGNAQAAGNAAASNYDGLVWRKLSRTRRVRSRARGEVTISFHVQVSGAPSRIRVRRSSGNPTIDQAAVDHVVRAGPFPPPPTGARRDFGYTYEARR